jgi:Arc/MetJ-type ribon-helix-helix transcriptional regulator
MKQKVSISIDEKKMKQVETLIKGNSRFRNKSHVLEYGLDKLLLEEKQND